MKKLIYLIAIFFSVFALGQVQDGVKYTKAAEVKSPENTETEIFTEVEKEASFPGGVNDFRQKVAENFDTSSINGNGKIRSIITFIVEKDGTLSDVKANGSNMDFNNEAIRTVSSIKEKWTPAEIYGQKVRSRYRIPLSMEFDEERQSPKFSLGNDAFKNLIVSNFRKNKVQGKGNERCEITFIVKKNGTVSDLKVFGDNKSFNKETMRAISKIKENWIPGKENGENVDFPLTIPFEMNF